MLHDAVVIGLLADRLGSGMYAYGEAVWVRESVRKSQNFRV